MRSRGVKQREATYTTLIFDLSEVLIAGLLGVEKVLWREFGIPEQAVLNAMTGTGLSELCRGEISEEAYLLRIREEHKWLPSVPALKKTIRLNFHRVVEGMDDLVLNLSRHYTMVLYSDHAREWIDYIYSIHSFLGVFSVSIFSFELGKTKDSPLAFVEALSRIGKVAQECVFIDDNPKNIRAAESVGISAVKFESANSLKAILKGMGIEC